MTVVMQRESTEYIYTGITGDEPSVGAECAFMEAASRPLEADWNTAIVVNDQSALWTDATSSGVTGDYYVAILIGSFGGTGVELTAGDYQVWIRLTDSIEQPVRIAPEALEIA